MTENKISAEQHPPPIQDNDAKKNNNLNKNILKDEVVQKTSKNEKKTFSSDEDLDQEIHEYLLTKKDDMQRWLTSTEEDMSELPGAEHILIKIGSSATL